MPVYEGDALILRTYKLGEADRIVVFLTRDRGKKRGVAAGARRPRSRFTGALEPLTCAGMAYFEKERRELVRINYVEPRRSPLAARNPDALGYVGYFAELIDEWAQEADPNEKLYRLGASVVEALAQGAPIDRMARYFEYWLLRLQGVYPSLTACQRCGADLTEGARLTPRERVFVCRPCGTDTGGPGLSADAVAFLRRGATVPPDRLGSLELSKRADRELESAHLALITTHLEKELRSTRVLREMRH
jgi:DNA repair protein RecO (recombination protein O)